MIDTTKKSLPPNWQWVHVDEAVSHQIAIFNKNIFTKSEFTYIDITSVDNTTKRIVAPKTIQTKEAPSRATYIVRTGDILIATVRPNLNAVTIIESAHDGAVCSNGFCVLRFKEGFCSGYFFYFFLSPQFITAVTELVQGAMYPAISDDDVTAFQVPIPVALDEQVEIAKKFKARWDTLQSMRCVAEQQLEALKAIPDALLLKYFRFKEREPLPAGWRWLQIGGPEGIATIINGSTPSSGESSFWNGDILWATPTDLGKLDDIYLHDTERKITKAGHKSCSTQLLPVGTVLLTSRAPVGNIAIAGRVMCTNQGFKSIVPQKDIDSLYLYFAIRSIIPEIKKKGHGNTFDELTKPALSKVEIPLPPTLEQQQKIGLELKRKFEEARALYCTAERQLNAISALPAATLREFFHFGGCSNA